MTYLIKMLQDEWEINQLRELYIQLKPKKVLEIGSYLGGTLMIWITNAEKDALICTIDDFNGAKTEKVQKYTDEHLGKLGS